MSAEPLPIGRNFTAQQLTQGFHKLEVGVPNHPFLAHTYLAPKDSPLDAELLGQPIELSPSTPAAVSVCRNEVEAVYFQVQAVTPPREIAAVHWLQLWADATGRSLHTVNVISPLFADSLVSFEIEGHQFMGRAAGRAHGNVLFLLFAFCPSATYQDWADKLGLFIASFRPTADPQHPTIEPRRNHTCGPIQFELPASWQTQAATTPGGGERLDALNLDDDGAVNGWIQVRFFPKAEAATRIDVIEASLATWQESGFQVGEMQTAEDQEVPPEIAASAHLKVFSLTPPSSDTPAHEGWLLVMPVETGHIAVSLLTPSRKAPDRAYVWMFNRRILELACGTLRP
ncbi:MAG: hypothetical protein NTW21_12130 [Verrucomicrobia bacterium]|nr:hypothetical protein [Verrucomicrobiota bacterium]